MSTIVVPDEQKVFWRLTYISGKTFTADEGVWNDQALLSKVGGVQVPMSTQLVEKVEMCFGGMRYTLIPEEPSHVFAFARYATCLSSEANTNWLYTLFGYSGEGYRLLYRFSPTGVEVHTQSSDDPFPL